MSEQETSFMQQLGAWSDQTVILALLNQGAEAAQGVRKAVRQKVLESYRNGQQADPSRAPKPKR